MKNRYAKVRENVTVVFLVSRYFFLFYSDQPRLDTRVVITNLATFTSHLYSYSDVCPAQSMGLVRYPATTAPESGSRTVIAQCADNARRVSSSLSVTCSSTGSWSGSPRCQCNSGYDEVTIEGRQVCLG